MEFFILQGVHLSERSEFGPQNEKRQLYHAMNYKTINSAALIYIQPVQ